jgi:hypothetical protein
MSFFSLRRLKTVVPSALVLIGIAGTVACDGDKKKEPKSSNPEGQPTLGGALKLKFVSDSQTPEGSGLLGSLVSPLLRASDFLGMNSGVLGQSAAGKLKAAKFRVIDIGLCGSTDESNGDACTGGPEFMLYREADQTQSSYDNFLPANAAEYQGWTNFVDETSTQSLAQDIAYSDQNVGKYVKVIVHFYRAFQINAEIALNDDRTVYTKASTDFRSNNKTGLDVTYASAVTDALTGPSEDAVFFLPNGGKTFYLQNPFEITADDVANQVAYKMVLAYDPDNLIKANAVDTTSIFDQDFLEGQIDTTNGIRVTAPFVEFAPVLAKSTETIMRDTYTLKFSGDNEYEIRLGLYYVKEDETKAVRAITSNLVYTPNTSSYMNFNPLSGIRSFEANADGTYKILQGAGKFVAIANFERHDDSKTGSGTQQICSGAFDAATGCAVTPTSVSYVSTFVGSEIIDAP